MLVRKGKGRYYLIYFQVVWAKQIVIEPLASTTKVYLQLAMNPPRSDLVVANFNEMPIPNCMGKVP